MADLIKLGETFSILHFQWALAGLCGYLMYFLVPKKPPYYVSSLYDLKEFLFSRAIVSKALEGGVVYWSYSSKTDSSPSHELEAF